MNPPNATHIKTHIETTMDSPFDTALRQLFQNEAEPHDDGFTHAVMAVLPARVAQRHTRWREWVDVAQWAAISLAASGAAALVLIDGGRVDSAHTLAGYTLIGLLAFWSVPSRWSRG